MSDTNKRNLVYFENSSMRGLYASMEEWQQVNNRRLLSLNIQKDSDNYCCIALTNPTEVVITSADGQLHRGCVSYRLWEKSFAYLDCHQPLTCKVRSATRLPRPT